MSGPPLVVPAPIAPAPAAPAPKKKRMNKYIKWFIFGVFLAVSPIVADYFIQTNHLKPAGVFNWHEIIGKGELYLVCAGIAGAGLGDTIASKSDWTGLRLISGGSCVVLLFLTAVMYQSIASDLRAQAEYNLENVAGNSITFFILTVIASAGCVMVAEE